ncbi:MAG: 1-deoxy-D-xylulose-5-phosphate synthase [Treponemataceae bacterium]
MLKDMNFPDDLVNREISELEKLAKEIRKEIISVVGTNGGHLASNLGAVELTIALHRSFKSPRDALIWDVSHQCYTHKILTNRFSKFSTLRTKNGLSGFTRQDESEHDFFNVGHSSTSISSALGLLVGRELQNQHGKVVAIIGDGALTGGMAFEALSHAGQISKNLIVVLNDNQMSISKNTGSLSKYLSRLTTTRQYQSFRYRFDWLIDKIPFANKFLSPMIFRLKRGIKAIFFKTNLFVDLGFEYVGPLDGHNIKELCAVFDRAKNLHQPVVVHVVTQKGRGYAPAESDPATFHGIGPFLIKDGKVEKKNPITFTEAFSNSVVKLAKTDNRIVAVTAAMSKGTGLHYFSHEFPHRFFDVGIAEQHAVTFAGGLAKAGLKPVVAIYSTFLQRAIDQIIHDIVLQKDTIIFGIDRCGAVPDDGETHQGIFDISLLRSIPHLNILCPASEIELDLCMNWASQAKISTAIRYPKTNCPQEFEAFTQPIEMGRGVFVSQAEDASLLLVCTGGIFQETLDASHLLFLKGIANDIYNLRFANFIDEEYFLSITKNYSFVIFIEDGVKIGGVSEALQNFLLNKNQHINSQICAFPSSFLPHGKRLEILESAGLAPFQIATNAQILCSKKTSNQQYDLKKVH